MNRILAVLAFLLIATLAFARDTIRDYALSYQGSVNGVINVQAAYCTTANSSVTLPMGALGNASTDDTAAIQNAILCASGMRSLSSGQMYVHYGHPRIVLPYTGAKACYKISQPLRLFSTALDFGSDPGGSNVGGSHAILCPTFAGPAVIAEGPGYYVPSYTTSLLSGSGHAFSSPGSGVAPIMLSDWLNSSRVNFNANTQFGIAFAVKLSSLGSNGGRLFTWDIGCPGCRNISGPAGYSNGPTIQMSVNRSGQTFCSLITKNNKAQRTSSDTGFRLNATHYMELDWNGSDFYCFRDGKLIVGPVAAAGHLWTSTASGSGLFNLAAFPDVQPLSWPDQGFNGNNTGSVAGSFDGLDIEKVALHTAAYTPATTKPTVGPNTQLIINFPSVCTSVGQSGCSTDGTILGHTSTSILGSGNVYLPIRSQGYGSRGYGTVTPSIHLHDLELCGTGGGGAPDGFFAIWSFDLELDHVTCSNANNIGFNLYSNEWNSWVHDLYIGGLNHHLGVSFGNAYNQSHDQNINDNGGMVATISAGSSGGQDDEFFQHDGQGISVYDWIYATTSFIAKDFSTDDGGSEPNHLANFHIDGEFAPGQIIGGFQQLLGSSGIPIEEWGGAPTLIIGTQFSYDGMYPSEIINYVDANSNTHLPNGPDTLIGAQIPENNGNPPALSNPSGWALDLGDPNGGDVKAIYHGAVGSGAPAVPTGATNLDGHTFRVSDQNGACAAGTAYTPGGSGRCEVDWVSSASKYETTGAQW
jgi:hypothetical protein